LHIAHAYRQQTTFYTKLIKQLIFCCYRYWYYCY